MTPERGAPLRLVMPYKYGYKSSNLITKLTFLDKGGRGLVTDGMPYYSETGDILPGLDHPFEFRTRRARSRAGRYSVLNAACTGSPSAGCSVPKASRASPRGGYSRTPLGCRGRFRRRSVSAAVPRGVHGRLGAAAEPPRATPPGETRRSLHDRPHPSRTPRHRRHLRRRRALRGHPGAAGLDQHSAPRERARPAGAGLSRARYDGAPGISTRPARWSPAAARKWMRTAAKPR